MKNKKDTSKKVRREFNIHLDHEDREVIDELISNNINISRTFKMFLRKYLKQIKQLNNDIDI